jgi:hypothetical protein
VGTFSATLKTAGTQTITGTDTTNSSIKTIGIVRVSRWRAKVAGIVAARTARQANSPLQQGTSERLAKVAQRRLVVGPHTSHAKKIAAGFERMTSTASG